MEKGIGMTREHGYLKQEARLFISLSRPSVILGTLIFLGVSILLAYLSELVLSVNITQELAQKAMSYGKSLMSFAGTLTTEADMEAYLVRFGDYMKMLEAMMPPVSAVVFAAVIGLASTVLAAGYRIFLLNTVNGEGAAFGNLLDGFGMALRVIALSLLQGLIVAALGLLLVVPGLIALYGYRMSLFLLLEHPEMGVIDCLRESRRMMKGNKGELFALDLSMLGWILFSRMPMIGYAVQVMGLPFMTVTYLLFYKRLRGETVTPPPLPEM